MKPKVNTKGAAALMGAALIYAVFGILIREMATMFSDVAQVAFRFVVVFLLLAGWWILVKRHVKIPQAAKYKAMVLGVLFFGTVLLYTIAVTKTTLANSVFMLYAGDIITALIIGTVVLKEKLTPIKCIAILLVLSGLAMYSSAIFSLSVGVIAAVCSGACDGIANGIRKSLMGQDRNTVLLYQFGVCSLLAVILLLIFPSHAITHHSLWPVLAGLIFALLQILLGNLLLYGFQHFDVNVGTVILTTELVFIVLIGWLFYNEIPTTNELLGGLLILLASIVSVLSMPRFFKSKRRREIINS